MRLFLFLLATTVYTSAVLTAEPLKYHCDYRFDTWSDGELHHHYILETLGYSVDFWLDTSNQGLSPPNSDLQTELNASLLAVEQGQILG